MNPERSQHPVLSASARVESTGQPTDGELPDKVGAAADAPSVGGCIEPPPVRAAVRDAVGQTAAQVTRESATRGSTARAGDWCVPMGDAEVVPDPSSDLVALLAHVRTTVTTLVGRRRADGTPIERVLPEVKTLVRAAAAGSVAGKVTETLLEQVVRWSIEAYYAPHYGPPYYGPPRCAPQDGVRPAAPAA